MREDSQHTVDTADVTAAIRKLKLGTAPGLDGIFPELYVWGCRYYEEDVSPNPASASHPRSFPEAVATLYRAMLRSSSYPHHWTIGLMKLLKKKLTAIALDHHRGLSLLPIPSKAWGKHLLALTLPHTERYLSEEQNGFRHTRNTEDHIFTLYWWAFIDEQPAPPSLPFS